MHARLCRASSTRQARSRRGRRRWPPPRRSVHAEGAGRRGLRRRTRASRARRPAAGRPPARDRRTAAPAPAAPRRRRLAWPPRSRSIAFTPRAATRARRSSRGREAGRPGPDRVSGRRRRDAGGVLDGDEHAAPRCEPRGQRAGREERLAVHGERNPPRFRSRRRPDSTIAPLASGGTLGDHLSLDAARVSRRASAVAMPAPSSTTARFPRRADAEERSRAARARPRATTKRPRVAPASPVGAVRAPPAKGRAGSRVLRSGPRSRRPASRRSRVICCPACAAPPLGGLHLGRPGGLLLHRREDLDALDRVDAEVGLELHLHRQHLGG